MCVFLKLARVRDLCKEHGSRWLREPTSLRAALLSPSVSVNMSGEEHKKGRASELEGQQQASGRAMFLLSEPPEGGSERRVHLHVCVCVCK